MRTQAGHRQALVLVLILGTLGASVALGARSGPVPPIPDVASLVGGTSWRADSIPAQGGTPEFVVYRQWSLNDGDGNRALLYVGTTAHVQAMVRWNGELGYEGEGYALADRGLHGVTLRGGRTLTVRSAVASGPADRWLVEYAVAEPRGVIPSGADALTEALLDAFSDRAGHYYLVRVSVPDSTPAARSREVADGLLVAVLPRAVAWARQYWAPAHAN